MVNGGVFFATIVEGVMVEGESLRVLKKHVRKEKM
jgi:hypothetical protein